MYLICQLFCYTSEMSSLNKLQSYWGTIVQERFVHIECDGYCFFAHFFGSFELYRTSTIQKH